MVSAAGSTAAEDCRIVHSNNPGAHEDEQGASNYASNYVSTTKYHLATFVPHNLYEQFHRVANVYFLAVSIMVLTPVTPISPTPIIMGTHTAVGFASFADCCHCRVPLRHPRHNGT